MHKFWQIVRLHFKVSGLYATFRYNFKTNKKDLLKNLVLYGILVFVLLQFLVSYIVGLNYVMDYTADLNMAPLIISIILLAYSVVSFFTGTFTVFSRLFLAKDAEFFAVLPVSSKTVFCAKLFKIYTGQLAMAAFFIVPAQVIYAMHMPVDLSYYIACLPVLLFAPVFPLLISSLFSVLFMGLAGKVRNRDRLSYIFYFVFLLVVMASQFLSTRLLPENLTPEFISQLLSNSSALVKQATAAYPFAGWMTLSLTQTPERLKYLGLLILSAAAGAALLIWIAGFIYKKAALAFLETPKGKKRVKSVEFDQSKPVKAIIKKEWQVLLKVPVYAVNALAGGIIMPVFMAISFLSLPTSSESLSFEAVKQYANNPDNFAMVVLFFAGILAFCGGLNTGGGTVLSREGRSFWLIKLLPVSPKEIVLGKLLSALSFSFACIILPLLLALVITGNIIVILSSAILGGLLCFIITCCAVMVDFLRPKFDWTNYTQVIKQSANAFFVFLLDFFVIGIFAGLSALLGIILPPYLQILLLGVLFLGISVITYNIVIKAATKGLEKL